MNRRILAVVLFVSACGGLPPAAQQNEDSGVAVTEQDAGVQMQMDAGSQVDAGSEMDAGVEVDAGSEMDAGVEFDAGVEVDAGVEMDAGVEVDAGTEMDAGVDAGTVTDAGSSTDAGMSADAGANMDAGVIDAGTPACTTDMQCGGDACVFGRCVMVTEVTNTYATQYSIEGIAVAYDDQSQPKVGWAYNDSAISGYSHFVALGPFGTRMNINTGLWSSASWRLTRRQLTAPYVSWVASYPGKYGVTMGTANNGVIFNNNETVTSFDVARNAAGDEFIAAILAVGSTSNTACEVRFAKKPSGGAWTTPTTIQLCQDDFTGRIAIHLRNDGSPAIILAETAAPSTLKILTQSSALSWSSRPLVTIGGRPGIVLVQQRDGRSQLLLWTITFSTSASNGDYLMQLLQLDDDQVTRTVPLGTFNAQVVVPYSSFDVQPDGTAWLLRNVAGTSNFSPVNVTRVDGATGAITTQQLGTVVRGAYSKTAIGVSASGEISILHAETLRQMMLRRLTPR